MQWNFTNLPKPHTFIDTSKQVGTSDTHGRYLASLGFLLSPPMSLQGLQRLPATTTLPPHSWGHCGFQSTPSHCCYHDPPPLLLTWQGAQGLLYPLPNSFVAGLVEVQAMKIHTPDSDGLKGHSTNFSATGQQQQKCSCSCAENIFFF